MNALRRVTLIFILSAFAWTLFEIYQLFNAQIDFFQFKQVPISIAFLITTIFFGLSTRTKFSNLSFLLFIASTTILSIGLYSSSSQILLFKIESLLLLFYGAMTFYSLSERKPMLFSLIYFSTALLLAFTVLSGISNSFIQISQGLFAVAASVCALLTVFVKKFN